MKIFALGVTGFIGGDAFYTITQKHPEFEWALLVRDVEKAKGLFKDYLNVRLVHGNLDSSDILAEEAEADIVCNWADSDHPNATKALISGLKKRNTPSYLIHTSGAGNLTISDSHNDTFGKETSKLYNDFDGVAEVTSLPDDAPHRNVDKIILASNDSAPNTAIVCPPCVYGEGRGPDKKRSVQVPEMIRLTLERGQAFQVREGRNRWRNVHVQDLSELFRILVEEATKPQGGVATWGQQGYYFAESGEHFWGDVSKEIGKIASRLGLIGTAEVASLSRQDMDAALTFGSILLGSNSKGEAIRARKLFGWEANKPSLFAELLGSVETEARRMKKL